MNTEQVTPLKDERKAVSVRRRTAPVARKTGDDVGSLMGALITAASNPDVNLDAMDRLMGMYERVAAGKARVAYYAALAEMQPEMPVVERKGLISVPAKDGKAGHETPYARWEDINAALTPVLSKHGFGLSFRVAKQEDRVVVTGILSHREGHAEQTELSLPMDTTGSKNNVQAIGSSVSYGKRYTAGALLNFTTKGEDDDGRLAGGEGDDFDARDQSAGCQAAIAAINHLTTKADFLAWKTKNAAGLQSMAPAEADTVVRLWNQRFANAR